ncbi:MAG: purine-nucleoside phosphorylase [Solirubrobacterales bacterium]|nr:purine-nucleoside phosphorylase [Solirubrobacterales bacterium]
MTLHLRPSAPIAPDVLLPGDPGRAMALAQLLMVQPKMSNHNRGLWGYSGETPEGLALTIQSTGMGGPSAAIVLTELAELGVRRAIRVGTCAGISPELELGSLLRVEGAVGDDGTSRALGGGERVTPDAGLMAQLAEAGPESVAATVASTDLFYEPDGEGDARRRLASWTERGAEAVEMEAAALFTLGPRVGVAVGCLLVVTDVFAEGERVRIEEDPLAAAAERMGVVAAAALSLR